LLSVPQLLDEGFEVLSYINVALLGFWLLKSWNGKLILTKGNSGFVEHLASCQGLFLGPSAQNSFAESLSRHNNTHDIVTFTEGRAVGKM
jgi:hypothetical protein